MATIPLLAPPSGTLSNFEDPETRTELQVVVTSTVLAVALVFYANRIYVKNWLMGQWTWDDATLFLALVFGVVQFAAQTYGVEKAYLGRHLWDISVEQSRSSNIPFTHYIPFILPPWILLFIKATFFILYIYIFGSVRWIRVVCWTGLICITIIHSTIGIYSFAIASPHQIETWEYKVIDIAVSVSIPGIIVDVMLFVIPVVAIAPLQLSTARKIGALLIFMTGGLAIVCEACTIYLRNVQKHSSDKHWTGVPVNISSQCEIYVGIICASLPSVAQGFRNPASIYQIVIRKATVLYPSLGWSSPSGSDTSGIKKEQASIYHAMKSTDRKYAAYFALNETNSHEQEGLPEMAPVHLPLRGR